MRHSTLGTGPGSRIRVQAYDEPGQVSACGRIGLRLAPEFTTHVRTNPARPLNMPVDLMASSPRSASSVRLRNGRLIDLCGMAQRSRLIWRGEAQVGWRPLRLAYEIEGRDVAVVLALQRRLVGVPLVTRINRGPMFSAQRPSGRSCFRSWRASVEWGHLLFGGRWLTHLPWQTHLTIAASSLKRVSILPDGKGGRRLVSTHDPSRRSSIASPITGARASASHRRLASVVVEESAEAHEWMIERHLDNMREGLSRSRREIPSCAAGVWQVRLCAARLPRGGAGGRPDTPAGRRDRRFYRRVVRAAGTQGEGGQSAHLERHHRNAAPGLPALRRRRHQFRSRVPRFQGRDE